MTGEVLKWNASIADYTNISPEVATGSSINDLPEPWCSAIGGFIDSGEKSLDNLRLELNGQVRWYSLQKSVEQNIEGGQCRYYFIDRRSDQISGTNTEFYRQRTSGICGSTGRRGGP